MVCVCVCVCELEEADKRRCWEGDTPEQWMSKRGKEWEIYRLRGEGSGRVYANERAAMRVKDAMRGRARGETHGQGTHAGERVAEGRRRRWNGWGESSEPGSRKTWIVKENGGTTSDTGRKRAKSKKARMGKRVGRGRSNQQFTIVYHNRSVFFLCLDLELLTQGKIPIGTHPGLSLPLPPPPQRESTILWATDVRFRVVKPLVRVVFGWVD